jgi:ABC-type enterochelin transport system substrate-binding protein
MLNLETIQNDKNSGENFSLILEWIEEEKKKLARIQGEVRQRLKFIEIEEPNLELQKEANEQSAECIRKMEEMEITLGKIFQDIMRRNKSIEEIENKIEGFKKLEKITARQLEKWNIKDKIPN